MADQDDGPKGIEKARQDALAGKPPEEPKPTTDPPPADEDGDEDGEDEDLAAENKRLKAALKKTNKDAERNRRRAKARERDEDDEDDEEPAEDDRVSKLEQEIWTRDAIEALRDAGAKGDSKKLRRVVRMLDSVHPSDVEDAIADLKDDDPDLFKGKDDEDDDEKPRKRRRQKAGPGGAESRGNPRGRNSHLSPTSQRMLGTMRGQGNWA